MHLSNGTLLRGGMYQIVRFIASGGFGCTYEAYHPMLEKKIAIKEFFPKSLCNRDSDTSQVSVGTLSQKPLLDKLKKKFIQEARSIAKLSHPGIVKVSDVFEENGTAYYVMDYIEGKSLGKIIEERGPLSEKESLSYIRQVCQALDYVHGQNRLHLDIKPGNIMIDDNGKAILIDFGASKQYDEENGENTSTLVGKTPGYAPIEQMGSDVSGFKPATDIYALGATLYKCLTGKTPLESTQLANGEELDPLQSNVSDSTKKAISAAMQVGSKKRPQSIEEFLSILNGANCKTQDKEETVYDDPKNEPSVENQLKEGPQPKISESSTNPQNTTPKVNKDVPTKEEPKSSKTKVYLGVAAAVIIVLLCWMAFGGKESSLTNGGDEGIAMLADSLNTINEQKASLNNQDLNSNVTEVPDAVMSTLQIIPPTNVKVGDEFKIIYRLSDGQGIGFKVNDILGCTKISGPLVSDTKNGQEYTYTYKADKEGTYSIPTASVKVEGKIIESNTVRISIQGVTNKPEKEVSTTQPEIGKNFTKNEKAAISQEPVKTTSTQEEIANKPEPVKIQLSSSGYIYGHEYVDLGLPSGLKWATCNVGALNPEDYGSYFAWGETRPKSEYNLNNSETFGKDKQWLRRNGYIGNNDILTLGHDAARQNWGGSWRMPTLNEIKELMNNTIPAWTIHNGTNGMLLKSKRNGNIIFFPAAGWRGSVSLGYRVNAGYYWSSTLCDISNKAFDLCLFSGGIIVEFYVLFDGQSVRPVAE